MGERDYRAEVLALYEAQHGKPAPGKSYPPEVWHNAPALMRQRGCSAQAALDAVLAGQKPEPKSFGPRVEFPETDTTEVRRLATLLTEGTDLSLVSVLKALCVEDTMEVPKDDLHSLRELQRYGLVEGTTPTALGRRVALVVG